MYVLLTVIFINLNFLIFYQAILVRLLTVIASVSFS